VCNHAFHGKMISFCPVLGVEAMIFVEGNPQRRLAMGRIMGQTMVISKRISNRRYSKASNQTTSWKPRFRVVIDSEEKETTPKSRRASLRPVLAFAVVTGVFALGLVVGRSREAISQKPPENAAVDLGPFWETWNLAERNFVGNKDVDRQHLVQGAIKGLLDSLGDQGHTHYETQMEFDRYVQIMSGEGHGIGLRMRIAHRHPRVLEAIAGSPAQAAGIEVGDVITQIDGNETTGLPLNQVLALVRGGPADSVVHLSVQRGRSKSLEFNVRRAKENTAPVVWQMVPEKPVMHLAIRQFDKRTHGQVRNALQVARNMKVQGLIIDLRNCPGGLVDVVMAVTGEFLPDGVVAIEQNAQGKQIQHMVKPGGLAADLPLCVLVNKETSSAAEIMAGALKDRGRGPVIGTRTAGLGTLLHAYRMCDGSVVFLATAEWITPGGQQIWHQGISPTIEMKLPVESDALFPGAAAYLNGQGFTQHEDRQLAEALTILAPGSNVVAQVAGSAVIN
jgi:carboxyl-terminal processing protease